MTDSVVYEDFHGTKTDREWLPQIHAWLALMEDAKTEKERWDILRAIWDSGYLAGINCTNVVIKART